MKGQFLLDDAVDDSRVVKVAGFDQIQRIRVQLAGRCRFIMDDAADTDDNQYDNAFAGNGKGEFHELLLYNYDR